MAKLIAHQNNERISDALYELVREQFEESQSIVISENGMDREFDFDHDTYYESFSFDEMVTYLLTH